MENVIQHIITAFFSIITLALLNKYSRKKISSNSNYFKNLKLPKFYLYGGLFFIAISIVCSYFIVLEGDIKAIIFGTITFILFGSFGSICYLWYKNHSVSFNNDIIESADYLGKLSKIKWSNINTIKFNRISCILTFKDLNGNKVKVHQHIKGFGNIISLVEEKTTYTEQDLKIGL